MAHAMGSSHPRKLTSERAVALMVTLLLAVAGLVAVGLSAGAIAHASPGQSVTSISGGVTAAQLAQTLAGSGVVVSGATYTGDPHGAGSFSGLSAVGFDSGVALSSGAVASEDGFTSNILGPNVADGTTANFGTAGDSDLDLLVAPDTTNDAAVLEFNFVSTLPQVSFTYVFASEEYNEFVGSSFNDVFAFYVNGTNCATVGSPPSPVSVNNINLTMNAGLYRNNDPSDLAVPPIDTELDGLTVPLTCAASVVPGDTNTLKLAIADTADSILDSTVFIQADSLQANNPPVAVDDAYTTAGTALNIPAPGVLANDSDADGDTLTAELIGAPSNGTLTLNANGSFTYTPNTGFTGTDFFTYRASDGAAASNVATVTITVGDVPPPVSSGGDVRVQPVSSADGQNQPAPTIFLGRDGQAGANAGILLKNSWENNDRLLFSVFDTNNENCQNAAETIGYSAAPTVTVARGPRADGTTWTPNDGVPSPDPVVADPGGPNSGPATTPSFTVSLASSTQCAGLATDVVVITFNNESSGDPTQEFALRVAGLAYDVSAGLTPGPIHNAVFAQAATGAAPPANYVNVAGTYGGNLAPIGGADPVVLQWTNTAFVSALTLAVGEPSQLINDGTVQGLGPITIQELQPDAFVNGNYTLTIANFEILVGPPAPVFDLNERSQGQVDEATATEVSRTYDPVTQSSTLVFNLDGVGPPPNGAGDFLGDLTISGIFGTPLDDGPIGISLAGPNAFADGDALTPDDQPELASVGNPGSVSETSDVNFGRLTAVASAINIADRIGGNDRYETAAKIATNTVNSCTTFAVLASGESFPDALGANFLAGALADLRGNEVPVLLTEPDRLTEAARIAIRNLGVQSVYIIGGTSAVSSAVEADLADERRYLCGGDAFDNVQNLEVIRLGGADRYDTNNRVIEATSAVFPGDNRNRVQTQFGQPSMETAVVATGEDFADALAAGPIAYSNFPLIITDGDSLSPQAVATMTSLDITAVIIVGGEAAVSAGVEAAINANGVSSFRLAGGNRYATAAAIADFERAPEVPLVDTAGPFDAGLGWTADTSVLARGDDFADALASGPYAGSNEFSLLLTEPTVLSPATQEWFEDNAAEIDRVIAIGLGQAITTAVLNAANAAIAG